MAATGYHNLLDLAIAGLGPFPDRPVLLYGEEITTLRELDKLSSQVAQGLMTFNLRAGDRLAVMLPESPEYLYVLFGGFKLGLTIAVFDPDDPEQFEKGLPLCGATALIIQNDLHARFRRARKLAPGIKRVAVSLRDASPVMKIFPGVEVLQNWLDKMPDRRPDVKIKASSPALITFDGLDHSPQETPYSGPALKRVLAAARIALPAYCGIMPGSCCDSDFLNIILPGALDAGAMLIFSPPEQAPPNRKPRPVATP